MRKDGGPVFPQIVTEQSCVDHPGMTLRQWYAGQALEGILAAHSGAYMELPNPTPTARSALAYADALIAAQDA